MIRDSFIFYRSFYEAIINLPQEDQCVMFKAIADYSLDGTETELIGMNKVVWTLIKPQLDANQKRYINGQKGGKHGNKGGRPKLVNSENNPIGVIDEYPSGVFKKTPNVNVNVNDNVNNNENVNKNENGVNVACAPARTKKRLIKESEDTFEERRMEFKIEVLKYQDKYDVELLRQFYNYWSEKVQNRWLMRMELEKTFEVDRRLIKWKANEKNFNKDEEVSLRKSFN